MMDSDLQTHENEARVCFSCILETTFGDQNNHSLFAVTFLLLTIFSIYCSVLILLSKKTATSFSLVTRKPVFGVCDLVRLKPACSATETNWSLEVLDLASTGILSKERTINVLI